jgi:hypothetical protein
MSKRKDNIIEVHTLEDYLHLLEVVQEQNSTLPFSDPAIQDCRDLIEEDFEKYKDQDYILSYNMETKKLIYENKYNEK